ncbi:MAG: peptidylprolyl isomerase [Chloroflexi bacterium]|nr:peptidylprolyl isomerase [Chloroflexota bacterium]
MAIREKKRIITSKHLARVERERLQRRYVIIAAAAVLVAVVILIGTGILLEGVFKPKQPVAQVNDTKISTSEFQTWARFNRYQLVNQYASYYEFMQSFADASTQSMFESQLWQIQMQLDPAFLGQSVIDILIEDVLIREEAERRGITVSEEETDTYIAESMFRYYPDGTPTPTPAMELAPTSTFSPLQMTLVSPPPTEVITDTEPVEPPPAPTEEEAAPTDMAPTPTTYTVDAYQSQYDEYLKMVALYADISDADLHWIFESYLFRQKVMDAITADIATDAEQVWARHILVADEEAANEVLARLEAGEDFADLARELSTDPGSAANGGDLGWFGKGQMVAEFEEAAFSLAIGVISEPVESGHGWHIIQALGREIRSIDAANLDQLRQETFQEWLTAQREEADVETFEWSAMVPIEPAIPANMMLTSP